MKRILSLLLVLLFIVGCSGDKYKDEALQAYVDHSNSFRDAQSISFEMSGIMKTPQSGLMGEEMDFEIHMNGMIDVEDFLMSFEIGFVDNIEGTTEKVQMYFDNTFLYMNVEDEWVKIKHEVELTDLELEEASKEMTLDDAKEIFDMAQETKYGQTTIDGVDGFTINAKMDMGTIIALVTQEAAQFQDLHDEIEQMQQLFQQFDITYETFLPKDTNTPATHNITIIAEILGSIIEIGPLTFTMEKSDEVVSIPNDAQNAILIDESLLGL